MQYELSSEVEKVANSLIKQFHPDLSSKKIVFVSQERKDKATGESQKQMRRGKPVFADVKVIGGLNAFLVSGEARTDENGPVPFVCMVVSRHAWNYLKPKQREGMIDEQLCRIDYDTESGRPSVLDYDAKAYVANLKRFGAWNDDLDALLKHADEFPLFADLDESVTGNGVKVKKAAAGADANNGKAETAEPPKSELGSLKDQVAKKRGRVATAGAGK